MSQDERRDAFGFVGPLPASHRLRQIPGPDLATGPEIGERLPDFDLVDHTGRRVSLHADRGNSKAAVVFFRSAVW